MLLLNMHAKPTSDHQARACSCTCASSNINSTHNPLCVVTLKPHHTAVLTIKAVNKYVKAAKQHKRCSKESTTLLPNLEQALTNGKRLQH